MPEVKKEVRKEDPKKKVAEKKGEMVEVEEIELEIELEGVLKTKGGYAVYKKGEMVEEMIGASALEEAWKKYNLL